MNRSRVVGQRIVERYGGDETAHGAKKEEKPTFKLSTWGWHRRSSVDGGVAVVRGSSLPPLLWLWHTGGLLTRAFHRRSSYRVIEIDASLGFTISSYCGNKNRTCKTLDRKIVESYVSTRRITSGLSRSVKKFHRGIYESPSRLSRSKVYGK